jgi:tRNA(fMet)-specific endonuclease VapC
VTRYLLDTNILSPVISDPHGAIAKRILAEAPEKICTSIIVAAELRFGAAKKGSVRLTDRVTELLSVLDVLPWAAPADAIYANLRTHLEASGTPIGANDLLIAAHALAHDLTLVTDNVREFERITGLKVENWLR